jgi:NAD(P)-dependent dehydrogenase (short-subunit alcohol dehydrogenase family)
VNYFVTGATGFIGRSLVARLLEREDAHVHVLVRPSSAHRFAALQARLPEHAERLHAVWGDIADPELVEAADRDRLAGTIDHVFHLAAAYDLDMDDTTGDRVNVEGTRNVVRFANSLGGRVRFQHASSVAVAGAAFDGLFTERMFDENQKLDHPYFRTKFEAERIVRDECRVPFRVYRPGFVVGDSETGEMDKVDGPYYFFPLVREIRDRVPKWLPLLLAHGGRVPIAPVDYVAKAMDHLAHRPGLDGGCFHLLQSDSPTVGELAQTLLQAADGPDVARKFNLPIPSPIRSLIGVAARRLPRSLERAISKIVRIPLVLLGEADTRVVFDDAATRKELDGSGIECPDFRKYAEALWRYWELHLDPVRIPARLASAVGGKVVMITGASSGIGFETARKVAAAGARTVLVARTKETLEECAVLIREAGGEAHVYPCDLSDLDQIDATAERVLRDLGHVDVLVNNAGRSIRRAVSEQTDRFHDFERTMQLNYFGAVRLVLRLLPSMRERHSGHIVNVSSIGAQANAPRFAAYVASKAALDAFGRCLSSEVRSDGIDVTTVYMPLVRTPMIRPTTMYRYFPAWTPEHGADAIVKSMISRPKSVTTPLGRAAAVSYAVWPRMNDLVLNRGFRLFPTSSAARGSDGSTERDKPTFEQVVFATLFRGEHW